VKNGDYMYILPAIDLLDGHVVRLAQGDYGRVTVYNSDPVAQAHSFADAHARWLHIVDLAAARSGRPVSTALIARIVKETGLKVEVGGGLRDLRSIEQLLDLGVTRVILGTKLATDPAFVREAVASFGSEALVAGVDARDGQVATDGWMALTARPAPELVAELASWGLRHVVYTDIARDGMRCGINADLYAAVADAASFPVIVSGGVARLDDIRAAAALGPACVEGIICGRALYEQEFSLAEALDIVSGSTASSQGTGL
jgi:phosphoribosylformimino-5-aminoimidazole carboxamide ribotide isomerase